MKTRFLIVGSGAAAVGVLYGLIDKYGKNISVDILTSESFGGGIIGTDSSPSILFPQKSKDGKQPSVWSSTDKSLKVYDSRNHSMTQFWGAGMMPARLNEEPEPMDSQLYKNASDRLFSRLQILGEEDNLARYLGRASYNKDWPNQSNFPKFDTKLNGERFCSGRGRISIISDTDRSCVICGKCMSGCPEDVIWHSRMEIRKIAKLIDLNILSGEVKLISAGRLVISAKQDLENVDMADYKLTFLATGVVSTSNIVLRSLDAVKTVEVYDTPVFTIPFLLFGKKYKQRISLANDMILVDGKNGTQLGSVYPFFDEIWETKLFRIIGKFGFFRRLFENHVGFIRLYSNRANALKISASLNVDGSLKLSRSDWKICGYDKSLIRNLKKVLIKNYILAIPIKLTTLNSAHYYGGAGSVASSSTVGDLLREKFPVVRVADAFTISSMPSISPTFSIITNAYLIAQKG